MIFNFVLLAAKATVKVMKILCHYAIKILCHFVL
jgi:hypothetical protein